MLTSLVAAPLPKPIDRLLWRASQHARVRELGPAPAGLVAARGDFGLPFIGHTLAYIRYGTDFSRDRVRRYGPVSWLGAAGNRIVQVAGPDALAEVYANRDRAFSQDGWAFLIDRFFHRGLMLMDFEEHHVHRRIMQEAFTRPRLAAYVNTFTPLIEAGVDALPAGSLRLYPWMKRLTLDVATEVFMGEKSGPDAEQINRAFVAAVRAPNSIVRYPLPFTHWRAGLRGRAVLERYVQRALSSDRTDGDDLFSALRRARTEDGQTFTDADVVNHMIFLMMAAHDTSTITATAAVYYLALHPEWQQRVREEALTSPSGLKGLEGMPILDRVIREVLRLAAPVPVALRRAIKDTSVLGTFIPAGTLVNLAVGTNHFDPSCWTNPDSFDPDRFLRGEDRNHRLAWVPFGGGVHKCIGMVFATLEVKAILAALLRRHEWSVPAGYRTRWDNTSLPIPVDGLPVTFVRRAGMGTG